MARDARHPELSPSPAAYQKPPGSFRHGHRQHGTKSWPTRGEEKQPSRPVWFSGVKPATKQETLLHPRATLADAAIFKLDRRAKRLQK
jgi:hypothetical protein